MAETVQDQNWKASHTYVLLKEFININDRMCMVETTSELVARWGVGDKCV
jgi:hypothetical protein